MGAGGVIVPPEGYFPAIAAVCRKYDVLMISDEVICGFGRTGEWFGAQTLDYPATSMSMAKQLTAGYLPLSAVAINRDMAEAIEANSGKIGTFGHGYTYGGHPVACAVGREGARDLRAHGRSRPRPRASPRASRAHLDRLAGHPLVGEVRALGLIGALELAPASRPRASPQPGKVGPRAGAGAGGPRRDHPGDRRHPRLLPADDHHRGRDRRDVRPGRGRARRDRSPGRKAEGHLG